MFVIHVGVFVISQYLNHCFIKDFRMEENSVTVCIYDLISGLSDFHIFGTVLELILMADFPRATVSSDSRQIHCSLFQIWSHCQTLNYSHQQAT